MNAMWIDNGWLIGAVLLLLVAGVIWWLRRSRLSDQSGQAHHLQVLEAELNLLRRRIAALEHAVGLDAAQAPAAADAASPYAQAIRLAHEGCDPAEVAARCGISRGEAELIISLYRSRAA